MSLLEKVVDAKLKLGCVDRVAALEEIADAVEASGSFYGVAKMFRVLVNDSGEDFAVEFMTAYNAEVGFRY